MDENVKCAFCGKIRCRENAQELGWIPTFFISEHQAGNGPVCPTCAAIHLDELSHADAPILKPGHEVRGPNFTLVDDKGNTAQVPAMLSAGKVRFSLPEGAVVSIRFHDGEIFVYYNSAEFGGGEHRLV